MSELVSTILSQNTSDLNSGRAFANLKRAFPTWEDLCAAPVEAIEEAIRVGGLASIKSVRIKTILREIKGRYGGFDLSFLQNMPLDQAKTALRSLDGVGPKTAACVLLFAMGRPAMVVDTHVYRVSRRLGLVDNKTSVEKAHSTLEKSLAPERVYPFHVNMITHGRMVCKAQRPRCHQCVLLLECDYGRSVMGTPRAEPTVARLGEETY